MVIITLRCSHCDSQNIVRNGLAPNGKQRYLCRDCRRQSRDDPTSN
nr:IS1 family transposase [Pyrinomonadaceae bacterium]